MVEIRPSKRPIRTIVHEKLEERKRLELSRLINAARKYWSEIYYIPEYRVMAAEKIITDILKCKKKKSGKVTDVYNCTFKTFHGYIHSFNITVYKEDGIYVVSKGNIPNVLIGRHPLDLLRYYYIVYEWNNTLDAIKLTNPYMLKEKQKIWDWFVNDMKKKGIYVSPQEMPPTERYRRFYNETVLQFFAMRLGITEVELVEKLNKIAEEVAKTRLPDKEIGRDVEDVAKQLEAISEILEKGTMEEIEKFFSKLRRRL